MLSSISRASMSSIRGGCGWRKHRYIWISLDLHNLFCLKRQKGLGRLEKVWIRSSMSHPPLLPSPHPEMPLLCLLPKFTDSGRWSPLYEFSSMAAIHCTGDLVAHAAYALHCLPRTQKTSRRLKIITSGCLWRSIGCLTHTFHYPWVLASTGSVDAETQMYFYMLLAVVSHPGDSRSPHLLNFASATLSGAPRPPTAFTKWASETVCLHFTSYKHCFPLVPFFLNIKDN